MAQNQENNPFHKGHDESKGSQTQTQIVCAYLKDNLATNAMVSAATGVPRENLCRIKRKLEKLELLWEVRRKPCVLTKYKAWYLTTNPDNAQLPKCQLRLF